MRVSIVLGSFSTDDGNGNEKGKNAIGLIRQTTTLHVNYTFFAHLFAVTARLRRFFCSLPTLECSPQEINSIREIRLHLTFSKMRQGLKKRKVILKVTFLLKLFINKMHPTPRRRERQNTISLLSKPTICTYITLLRTFLRRFCTTRT